MVKLWIDCDPGHDDAFALLLASHDDRADLIGVSAVHGNTHLGNTYDNISSILIAVNKPSVPIFKGSDRPLVKASQTADFIHGKSGIDGTDLLPQAWSRGARQQAGGLEEMAALMGEHEDIYLCATGPMTNIALLTREHPEVMEERVARLVIMGGSIEAGGNVTRSAEFNTWACPESMRCVLEAPCWRGKIVLAPLDITHSAILGPGIIARMERACRSSAFARLWIELGTFFSETYKREFGFMHGGPVHDPITVAWCLDHAVAQGTEMWIDVDCSDGPTRGKMVVDRNRSEGNLLVLQTLAVDTFWDMIIRAMVKANVDSPVNRTQS